MQNIYTATIQSTMECRAVLFGKMAPSHIDRLQVSHNLGMRLILGVPRFTRTKMMRHELQMLPVKHSAKLSRAKIYRMIRGNTTHPLHTTINMSNVMDGSLGYRNVNDSHQDNWRNQHNYKETTPPMGTTTRAVTIHRFESIQIDSHLYSIISIHNPCIDYLLFK